MEPGVRAVATAGVEIAALTAAAWVFVGCGAWILLAMLLAVAALLQAAHCAASAWAARPSPSVSLPSSLWHAGDGAAPGAVDIRGVAVLRQLVLGYCGPVTALMAVSEFTGEVAAAGIRWSSRGFVLSWRPVGRLVRPDGGRGASTPAWAFEMSEGALYRSAPGDARLAVASDTRLVDGTGWRFARDGDRLVRFAPGTAPEERTTAQSEWRPICAARRHSRSHSLARSWRRLLDSRFHRSQLYLCTFYHVYREDARDRYTLLWPDSRMYIPIRHSARAGLVVLAGRGWLRVFVVPDGRLGAAHKRIHPGTERKSLASNRLLVASTVLGERWLVIASDDGAPGLQRRLWCTDLDDDCQASVGWTDLGRPPAALGDDALSLIAASCPPV